MEPWVHLHGKPSRVGTCL